MKTVTKIDKIQHNEVTKKEIRVAAYCRVSTGSDAQLESLDVQKKHYERYITSRNDWKLVGIYADEGITGTKTDKRPKLIELIADCKAKKIDFVITKSISRFSRNTADCLSIVRALLDLNIPIYFERENINTASMENELFLSILSSMAEDESVSISQNNKWGIKKRFADGTYKLASVPYGYDRKDGEIVIHTEQAEIVKRIFSEVLCGKGTTTIAKHLNEEQVPTKKGGRWTSNTVLSIISNERYTGDCIFQKTYTDSNFNRHKNNGWLDMYYVSDHHDPIISRDDYERATALIKQHAKEKGIERGNNKYLQRYAFSGNIFCGECGNTFRRRTHQSYIAWTCNTHLSDKDKCSMLYVKDEDLKLAFATMLNKLIYGYKTILKPYFKALHTYTKDESVIRIKQLKSLIDQNTEQRQTLQKLLAQGYIDRVLFTQENNSLLTQANDLKSKIETLNNNLTGSATMIYETERLIHFCECGKALSGFDEDLFKLFVDHIKVNSRQEVIFVLHCGLSLKERI